MAQPSSAPRWSRQARPNGPRRNAEAVARPGRSGRSPAPWSRRAASAKASPVPPAATASGRASTHQRSAANGRANWIQASGEAHDSQEGPAAPAESPTPRSTKATPSTPSAIPRAVRALEVSWAATAVIPVKASPQQPMPSASAAEPAAGRPTSGSATHSRTETARRAAAAVASPATRAACRPTTAEPTSSSRPASSSDLVCLITTKMAISAAKMPAQIPYRQVVSDPREEPSSLPYRKRRAGLAPPVAASAARPAAVGYSFLNV